MELRERAVWLYRESDLKPVIARLVRQLNMHPQALRNGIRQDEADLVSATTGPAPRCWRRTAGCGPRIASCGPSVRC